MPKIVVDKQRYRLMIGRRYFGSTLSMGRLGELTILGFVFIQGAESYRSFSVDTLIQLVSNVLKSKLSCSFDYAIMIQA